MIEKKFIEEYKEAVLAEYKKSLDILKIEQTIQQKEEELKLLRSEYSTLYKPMMRRTSQNILSQLEEFWISKYIPKNNTEFNTPESSYRIIEAGVYERNKIDNKQA